VRYIAAVGFKKHYVELRNINLATQLMYPKNGVKMGKIEAGRGRFGL